MSRAVIAQRLRAALAAVVRVVKRSERPAEIEHVSVPFTLPVHRAILGGVLVLSLFVGAAGVLMIRSGGSSPAADKLRTATASASGSGPTEPAPTDGAGSQGSFPFAAPPSQSPTAPTPLPPVTAVPSGYPAGTVAAPTPPSTLQGVVAPLECPTGC
ncbi:MAG TPA: hypothetical protein VFC99_00205 [Acidimicrobiia bacterium]|nr:hypothetical protein [Acidimicrobiia bacterium]